MIQLDEIGEKALQTALANAENHRIDPSLRKKNEKPDSMEVIGRKEKDDADQS